VTTPASDNVPDRTPVLTGQISDDRPPIIRYACARADDKTIDDTIHKVSSRPYTEDETKGIIGVEFIRTPFNERVVFQNARYLGRNEIVNAKFGYAYGAYLWLVEFLCVGMIDFKEPLPGILQITCKRWGHACLGDPENAFNGVCAVVANRQRQIVEIQSNLGETL
jgi:hypothetical protein